MENRLFKDSTTAYLPGQCNVKASFHSFACFVTTRIGTHLKTKERPYVNEIKSQPVDVLHKLLDFDAPISTTHFGWLKIQFACKKRGGIKTE